MVEMMGGLETTLREPGASVSTVSISLHHSILAES